MNVANIRVSSNDLPVRQIMHYRQQLSEKFSLSPDDGYSTDSRSNTTASIYSPLSSSLSSLSTTEGSPHSGSMHPNTPGPQNGGQKLSQMQNIQPGPIQKGPNLHVASKTLLTRKGVIPVKRKGVKVEEEPNISSLEDRLRALTTIDEEDLGLSKAHRAMNPQTEIDKINQNMRSKNISSINHLDTRHSKITVEGQQSTPEPTTMSMYYQAVPVALTGGSRKNPHVSIADRSETAIREAYFANAYTQLESSGELTKEGWRKYTDFLNKQSDIPSKNINSKGPRMVSNVDVNGSAVTGLEKCPRIDSSRLYREQDDDRAGVGNYDRCSQYLGDQSSHDSGLHQGVDTNGYHPKENDCTNGRDDRMNILSSYDNSLGPGFQGSLSHTKTLQYKSRLYGQTQPSYTHQQKADSELGVADQYVNIQQPHSFEQDFSPGYALEDRISYPPQSYTVSTQQHLVTLGTPLAGIPSRASWQQLGSSFDQQHLSECRKLTQVGLERNSLDLGNIPKLQKQIRAVSDLCLQASRKHMFASSADIHKLFSGQKKQPASLQHSAYMNDQEQDHFYDPGLQGSKMAAFNPEAFPVTQNSFQPKPKLQVIIPPDPVTGKPISDPFRADHHIHIPPEAWIDVTSVPSSVPQEGDRVYIHLQNQPRSPRSHLDKSQSLPASVDLSCDRSHANCLSSGYSSESELQQIESNAEALKKLLKSQTMEKVAHYQVQEFQPLQQLLDEASSSERDDYEGLSERNIICENKSMLAQTDKSLYQPVNPQYFSQNESSLSQSSAFYSTAYSYVPTTDEDLQKGSSKTLSFNMFRSNSDILTHNSNIQSICYNQTHSVSSQSEVYSLRNNSTTFTDLQTCPDIHLNRPPLLHSSSIQPYNSAGYHNQQNLPELSSYGSTSSLPPPQHLFPPFLSSCNCEDCHQNATFYWHNGSSKPQEGQPHTQSSHLGYPQINGGSSFAKLPSQEMDNKLNVPFETSVLYSDQGNQLSTLV